MEQELVSQIREALNGGIPKELLIQRLVQEGMDPNAVKAIIAQAESSPPKQQAAPPMQQQRPQARSPQAEYSPVPGQPNSSRHVRSERPDPQVKQTHIEANREMQKIVSTHHNTEQTISELQALMFLSKYLGWSLMVGDGIFSYWALKVALNNEWMAIYLAIGICSAIFIMGVAITIKSVDEIFVLDKDESNTISKGEWAWFFVRVFVAIVCVGTDVLTNFMGMDTLLARSIVPIPLVPGWIVSLFLAIAIMLLPQVIVSWGDVNMRKLARLKPLARIEAADVQGDTNWATGYQKVVATQTTPAGQSEGVRKVKNWMMQDTSRK